MFVIGVRSVRCSGSFASVSLKRKSHRGSRTGLSGNRTRFVRNPDQRLGRRLSSISSDRRISIFNVSWKTLKAGAFLQSFGGSSSMLDAARDCGTRLANYVTAAAVSISHSATGLAANPAKWLIPSGVSLNLLVATGPQNYAAARTRVLNRSGLTREPLGYAR